jgi:pimeloyl-ACP methyl ester carboxylesterase
VNATNEAAIRRDAALRDALATVSDEELFRLSTGELRNVEAFQGYDFTSRLSELTIPVSVIHGTADATVPYAWGEALHAGIPHSDLYPIPDADHGVLLYPAAQQALRAWADRVLATVPV